MTRVDTAEQTAGGRHSICESGPLGSPIELPTFFLFLYYYT